MAVTLRPGSSAFAPKEPLEQLLFESPSVGIGTFRCRPDHPLFRDSGPSSTYCFVFPRTSVMIQHADGRPFLADPRVVTYYNAGQVYSRTMVSPEGDRGDWFALSPELAEEIVAAVGRGAPRHSRAVFPFTHGPSGPAEYLEQRLLCERVRCDTSVDTLEVEETVLNLLAALAAQASGERSGLRTQRPTRRHRAIAADARILLAQAPAEPMHLRELAARLSCSVFHLCRVFKAVEGTTIHAYRLDTRLRMALEPMNERDADLTRIALDHGFCSHSHFTAAFRRHFGLTPSQFTSRARVRR